MGLDINFFRVRKNYLKEIEEEDDIRACTNVAYFRKVNFLLPYFNYEGNCMNKEITLAQMKELVRLCEEVIKHPRKGKTLLPTRSGFFFGDTDYDEYYIRAVKNVKETFEGVIKTDKGQRYFMRCWW